MVIRPLGNRVLVKPIDKEGMTKGGILLPDEAKRKPQRGVVVSTGPGELRRTEGMPGFSGMYWPIGVKKGDHVLFARYAGADVGDLEELDGCVLLSEQDIIAVVYDESSKSK